MIALAMLAVYLLVPNYGERIEIRNGELYYTENVSQEQAQSLAALLDEQFGELENFKSFQLDEADGNTIVRMCAIEQTWQSDDMDNSWLEMEALLEHHGFTDRNVVFEICNEFMQTRKLFDEI